MVLTRWFTRQMTNVHTLFSRSSKSARRRPVNPLSGVRDWQLEERCLPSADPLPMPVATATNLSDLFFLGDTTIDGTYYGPVPDKFLTFTNNSAQTVFPYFRNANTGQPKGADSYWDPMDPHDHESKTLSCSKYGNRNGRNGVRRVEPVAPGQANPWAPIGNWPDLLAWRNNLASEADVPCGSLYASA